MSTTKRTRRITIERHEIKITRPAGAVETLFCRRCDGEVHGLSRQGTADLFRISAAMVDQLIDDSAIHFIETDDDELPLICGGTPSEEQGGTNDR